MFASNTSAANGAATYIEDVFSTYLYTGDDTNSRVITNGIDLSGKGGMVITAPRNPGNFWSVADTARGASNWLYTQSTGAQQTGTDRYGSFNSTGYTMGSSAANGYMNYGGYTYASWTFRKQPKFFDVVTYTGNATFGRAISHNLGSVPGCIIVKRLDTTQDWCVYHRSNLNTQKMVLNSTAAVENSSNAWGQATPTDSVFYVGATFDTNGAGSTYVAYLFAHNAGGFGLTGTDNVISCGSFQGISAPTINLGWEPQFLLIKPIDYCNTAGDWFVIDNMRGARGVGVQLPRERFLNPNATYPESLDSGGTNPYGNCDSLNITATGFKAVGYPFNGAIDGGYRNYIYIAIRRGPMKTPTSGTSVFAANKHTVSVGTKRQIGFAADLTLTKATGIVTGTSDSDRLRGYAPTNVTGYPQLLTSATDAESTGSGPYAYAIDNTSFTDGPALNGAPAVFWNFRRAPGFFDVVCYTGTGSATTQAHNLGVAPELMIVKQRNVSGNEWMVYSAATGNTKYLYFPGIAAAQTDSRFWNNTTPTSSVFSIGTYSGVNASGSTYVAYLFASCPGVSKVGSYTGTGTTLQINCGFTGGARFVLIKRTDSTGDWYVWDSARGIVAGNDPYLLLNSTAAEVTSTDYVDTYSAGFEISSTAPAAINASGGTFIYLAIA